MKKSAHKKQKNSHVKKIASPFWKGLLQFFFMIPVFVLLVLSTSLFFTQAVQAASGINPTINFQGRLVNKTDGTNVTDGNYTFVFKIYDSSSAGTKLWGDETQSSIPVTNGVFQVALGSVRSFATDSLDFNQDNLWLDITFNGESFGSRVRLSAVPYAFNAQKVSGLTVTQTTGTLTISNGKTLTANSSLTLAGTDSKTLTVNDSTTLGTNAITFGGGEVVTFSATNAVTFTTSGTTSVTLPTSGTLLSTAGGQTVSGTLTINSANSSSFTVGANGSTNPVLQVDDSTTSVATGLKIVGAATGGTTALSVIDSGSNANLSLDAKGSGTVTINGTATGGIVLGASTTLASGKPLIITGGSGDPTATAGTVWYDSSAAKFKIVEGSTVKVLCNTTDAGCGTGGGGSSNWTIDSGNGVIYPINTTLDLLAGGTSTASAKFSVLNLTGSNTPVASVSSGISGTSTSIAANGVIQTAKMQPLTIGSSTTGPIQLSPKGTTGLYVDGSGNVGVNTTAPGYPLDFLSTNATQFRFGYNTSNYFTGAISSTGGVTFDAAGSGAKFTFADDVTVSSGGLTLGTTGSSSGLVTLNSSGGGISAPTIQTDSSGNLTIQTNQSSTNVNLGSGNGNITMSLTNAADVFIADKTLTLGSSYSVNDYTFKRVLTAGSHTTDGALVYITDTSNGSTTMNPDLLFVDAEPTSGTFSGNLLRLKAASTDLLKVTSTGQVDLVGGLSSDIDTLSAASLKIGASTASSVTLGTTGTTTTAQGTFVVGTGSNKFTFNPSSGPTYTGTARPTKTLVLSPEYAGATLTADGDSNITGSMTSDNTLNAGSIGWKNYYQWTSTVASPLQDYTVAVRVTLPQDFDSWQTGSCGGSTCALEIAYQTGVSGTTDNTVSVQVNNAESTPGTVICTISAVSSTTWTTTGCTSTTLATSPTWNTAGATAIIRIKLAADSTASALARVGDITLRYYAKF